MPISSFQVGLQKVLSFLPGTYGTSLIKNHALNAALNEVAKLNIPSSAIISLKDTLDCNLSFFGHSVSQMGMFSIMIITIIVLLIIYILQNVVKKAN